MNKFLLSALCAVAVFSSAVAANPTFTEMKTVSFNDIITPENANRTNKVFKTENGDVYLTGLFDTEFTAATMLAPIATSSYIIKLNQDLTPQFNLAIQGAATITDIAALEVGFCVVGTFADEVVFESTDGNSKTIEGMKIDGVFTAKQNASFIATYGNAGNLMTLSAFVPEAHSELANNASYELLDGAVYFKINKVEISDQNLIVSAFYTGKTSVSNTTFEAGYLNMFDIIYQDLAAGAVFQLQEAGEGSFKIDKIATLTPGNNVIEQSDISAVNFTYSDDVAYVGFLSYGDLTLEILDYKKDISTPPSSEGDRTFGFTIASVGMFDMSKNKDVLFVAPTTSFYNGNSIDQMTIVGDELLIGGIFCNGLGFDNSIKAVGDNDMFVTSLNRNTLAVNWNYATGYDEKDLGKNQEIFKTFSVLDGFIRVNGYSEVKSTRTLLNNHAYNISPEGAFINSTIGENICTTGSFGVANDYYEATVAQPANTGVTLKKYSVALGVNDAIADNDVVAYPNPTTDILNFSSACDVKVFAIDGKEVANQNDATSINVSSLSNGIYFVNITKDNASKTVKIIKK